MAAKALVMVVDDEADIRTLICEVLKCAGHDVIETADTGEALSLLEKFIPDLLLVDWKMPKMDGMTLIEEARKCDPTIPAIMLTGHSSINTAVEAMRRGACDFLEKPFKIEDLKLAVAKALEKQTLRREVLHIRSEQCRRHGEIGSVLISASSKMAHVFRMIKKVAKSPTTTVLLQGESGTGKELIARAIHLCSDRRNERFMDINCAALTETLLEAEIFGYEKGAFTGAANTGKPGLFEVANGGTVFLDEIGEMSLPLQAKLLRVLQEKCYERVGGIDDVHLDVRVIASTNRNLEQMVNEGKFRLDLLYRLRVVPITVPPLRERPEDIFPIAQHYADIFSAELGRKISGFCPETRAALEAHIWPGNVRELKNVIERAVIMCGGDRIKVADFAFDDAVEIVGPKVELDMRSLSLAEMEKQLIHKVLKDTSWRRSEAARILGINRTTLYNKIRDYALMQGQS